MSFLSPSLSISNTRFEQRSIAASQAENKRLREALNRYEAAQIGGTNRPWTPGFVRDARFDANQFTRWELTRKIRDAACNSWLVQRLWELDIRYSVGPDGLTVTPATGDKEFDKAMGDAYGEWCQRPCIDSQFSMRQVNRLEAGETHIDGEVFENLTYRKPRGSKSIPAIQLIESHRVGSSTNSSFQTESDSVVDGIQLDPLDHYRPIGAWIADGFHATERVYRPFYDPSNPMAGGILHIYDPERVGMGRAITPYHSVLNDLQDLMLLETFEMDRAKAASAIANVMTTQTGEVLGPEELLNQMANGPLSGFSNSTDPNAKKKETALNERIMAMQRVLGSRTIALKPGEDIKQLAQTNPSAATQWFWQYKIGQICIANGVPMILVLPNSLQGTVTRAVIDDANSFFKRRFNTFKSAAIAKYRFFADWARTGVKGLPKAPPNWMACHVSPPRSIGVDVGRDSVAMLAGYNAGVLSLEDIVAPFGTTAERVTRRKANNIADVKEIAAQVSKERGVAVTPGEIANNIADMVAKLAQSNEKSSAINTYGVAVRAGVVTPNLDDEKSIRETLGLPPVNSDVERVWGEDGGARRPITLSTPEQIKTEATGEPAPSAKPANPQENDEETEGEPGQKEGENE